MAKYTKQDLYTAYAKHDSMGLSDMHEPGTDPDCAICDEINRITADLEGITVADLLNNNQEDGESDAASTIAHRTRMAPKLYKVALDGEFYLWRVTKRSELNQLEKKVAREAMQEIPASEYTHLNVFTPRNAVISLNAYVHANSKISGPIAKLKSYRVGTEGLAERKAMSADQWVFYDGTNSKAIKQFVLPLTAGLTRKGKVQITTHSGSFSIDSGEYLIKLPTGLLLNLTAQDFYALYEIMDSQSWVITDDES